MKKHLRGPIIYLMIIGAIILLSTFVTGTMSDNTNKTELSYNEFLELAQKNEIQAISTVGDYVYVLKTGSEIKAEDFPAYYDYKTYNDDIGEMKKDLMKIYNPGKDIDELTAKDIPVNITSNPEPSDPWYVYVLPYIMIFGTMALFWFVMMKKSNGGNVMNFGKTRVKDSSNIGKKVTFDDVAGADEEKQELQEVVDFLKNPAKYVEMGARIPKGVLLVGPPGTGKTLLAKATAGEAGVPFFSISGSDFVEMFVGVGASRVRDLFDNAKKNSPCVIFIDEIDAVGRRRGAGLGGGHDEREQTLNQLLVEMDGFVVNQGIIVLAATNRADILDPALLRPGRFDRQIVVNAPDVKGREEVLKVHCKNKPLDKDVDLKTVAKITGGFTGADLENLMNESAILSVRRGKKVISMQEVQDSIMRVIAGTEKKSHVVTPEDLKLTAYHEAGHAIVAKRLPNCDPVQEVSIIPRGMAAGYTVTIPDNEKSHVMKSKLIDGIAMTLAGRAAEEIVFGDVSTGAYSDLKHANETARNMITKYGMSEELGLLFYGDDGEVFLGKDYGHTKGYSEKMAFVIDEAVKKLIDEGYATAKRILRENRVVMDAIVERLLEKEKIDGKEFNSFFEEDYSVRTLEEPIVAEEKTEEVKTDRVDSILNDVFNK